MQNALEGLHERLLRGGVAGRPAGRYIAELRDHFEDLRDEEQRAGRSAEEARSRAEQRLGDTDALAEAMIARAEFQAWGARAPAFVYVAAPAVILALATAFWLVALVGAVTWLKHAAYGPTGWEAWMRPLADGLAWVNNAALAVMLGWGLVVSAMRQRAPPAWPMLGLVVLAAAGAALQVQVTLPATGVPGEINWAPEAGYWARFALDLAVTATPLALLHLWRSGRALKPVN